jgi:ApaG protein
VIYEAVTEGIRVTVTPRFLPDKSDPDEGRYFWAYTVEVTNIGYVTVQLCARHWKITDGKGRLQEVRGPGVVGEKPIIGPGECYEYTSGCPLGTSSGFMVGTYLMQTQDGDNLEVIIPAFSLDIPEERRVIN